MWYLSDTVLRDISVILYFKMFQISLVNHGHRHSRNYVYIVIIFKFLSQYICQIK